ncbi:hypothetical protein MARHY3324 [Marinobacter nauticus ATCC 49840]|nr:hypothetical protein MARHY3324 [Marinobacter nauticus ATCC 49840]
MSSIPAITSGLHQRNKYQVSCDPGRRVDKHLHSATYAHNIKHYRLYTRTIKPLYNS